MSDTMQTEIAPAQEEALRPEQVASLAAGVENHVLMDSHSSYGMVTLPCGYLDPKGVLHREVVIREITGEEEDMLASRKVPEYRKFSQLLVQCVESLGTFTERKDIIQIMPELLVADRTHLLFQIRIATLGPIYEVFDRCPECGLESYHPVDLSDLKVVDMPTPLVRQRELVLPRSKKKVVVRFLNGRMEEEIAKSRDLQEGRSAGLLARIVKLDGRAPIITDIKRLVMADRNFLHSFFDREEGGVDTTHEYECSETAGGCGTIYNKELSLQRGFFFPSSEKTQSS